MPKRRVPKPIEKTSTRTPNARATTKWPHSWTRTITPSPIATATIPVSTADIPSDSSYLLYSIDRRIARARTRKRFEMRVDLMTRQAPRFAVSRKHIVNRTELYLRHQIEHAFDHPSDSRTRHASLQDRSHGHFVA